MNIFDAVRSLELPLGAYVVFGSGPMAARGLRDFSDIDLLVTDSLYTQLKEAGWSEGRGNNGGRSLTKDNVEAFTTWDFGQYRPDPAALIARAEMLESVPFVPLEEVLRWKEVYGREKDRTDAEVIRKYLESSAT